MKSLILAAILAASTANAAPIGGASPCAAVVLAGDSARPAIVREIWTLDDAHGDDAMLSDVSAGERERIATSVVRWCADNKPATLHDAALVFYHEYRRLSEMFGRVD